ncbi:acyl-homoserine-lactone synthase [Agrobacterium vitis]|uniref:Acyl-homoserine-lactone synthase n=1 Tax=Agrobacterium vitis TaxID=373 RepID=A0AAE2RFL6_AGRVI|nr:acyl-homoserine-lactone synthase [Agrobacterium vitis]MBF2716832.1 N-acyl-L-homoserine lactone (AHL) synthase [Agrobacterium vitis]MUZ64058.1 N-acyl-L-homoserine lactone (AHL) synthase [Agrobacterium vitis]MVA19809.1 N-acyl-L-homoserine lactone (AHL) synthase [Agrobacterium vitis]
MFFSLQAHNYDHHQPLMEQMFKLRKRVFQDTLKWDVCCSQDKEYDIYDTYGPAYVVWCSKDGQRLYGSMRLMPTTGPTLLYDTFRSTFPKTVNLVAAGIWEGTRLCIDEDVLAKDHPDLPVARAFGIMLLTVYECALAHGIKAIVANYEPRLKKIYDRAGADVLEIGRADGYGKYPVCCGTFEINHQGRENMRHALKVHEPLFSRDVPNPEFTPAFAVAA